MNENKWATSLHRSVNVSHPEQMFVCSHLFSFPCFCCHSIQRSNCYMVCAGDAISPSSSSRSNSDLEIGCLIDLATGLVSFSADGKDLSTTYQVKVTRTLFHLSCTSCLHVVTLRHVYWLHALKDLLLCFLQVECKDICSFLVLWSPSFSPLVSSWVGIFWKMREVEPFILLTRCFSDHIFCGCFVFLCMKKESQYSNSDQLIHNLGP